MYADISFCPLLANLKMKKCSESKVSKFSKRAVNYFGLTLEDLKPWTRYETNFAEAQDEVTAWLNEHSKLNDKYKVTTRPGRVHKRSWCLLLCIA